MDVTNFRGDKKIIYQNESKTKSGTTPYQSDEVTVDTSKELITLKGLRMAKMKFIFLLPLKEIECNQS